MADATGDSQPDLAAGQNTGSEATQPVTSTVTGPSASQSSVGTPDETERIKCNGSSGEGDESGKDEDGGEGNDGSIGVQEGSEEGASGDMDDAAPPLSAEEISSRLDEATSLKLEGNALFKSENFEEALEQYTKAVDMCPPGVEDLAVFLGNRSACLAKLGNDEECVEDCTGALELRPAYTKVRLRRAEARERLEKYEGALEDYQQVLKEEPSNSQARQACARLPRLVEEQREKLKEEMFGKLKQLGNMCLKPFGLSTNNFQMVQDPSTGSYSVNFKQ